MAIDAKKIENKLGKLKKAVVLTEVKLIDFAVKKNNS